MLANLVYRTSGLVSILITLTVIAFALMDNTIVSAQPISHYLARNSKRRLFYAIPQTLSLVFLLVFMLRWVMPRLGLPYAFAPVCLIACLSQIVVAWVPLTVGKARKVHLIFADITMILAPVILILLLFSPVISRPIVIADLIALTVFSAVATSWIAYKQFRHYYLFAQATCILVFYGVLLAIAFT